MSHALATKTNGQAAIAYAGAKPWHGLGSVLSADDSIETWTIQAGLDWEVKRAVAQYVTESGEFMCSNREVLYRNDTGAELGLVSGKYKEVQPAQVMEFFRDLTETAGFQMEVAGALKGGKRIWALAKVGEGAILGKGDEVRPYLLLHTSFDGSSATVAQLTTVRVVCQNTLSMTKSERCAANQKVSVNHVSTFNEHEVKKQLQIVTADFDSMMGKFDLLASRTLRASQRDDFLFNLFSHNRRPDTKSDVTKSRGYKKVLELFEGAAIGSDLAGAKTRWAMLNAVTEYVDHHIVANADSRLESAWFGKGDGIKQRALDLLLPAQLV